jgi:DNA invertase Pin-like site-specific DNA recombinase
MLGEARAWSKVVPGPKLSNRAKPVTDVRFVSYLRAATGNQARSGLNIEGQRKVVAKYLNGHPQEILAEFIEIESRGKTDRPELTKAFIMCRSHHAVLVVAKIDQLTRSHSFLSKVVESGIDVRFCDLPQLEGPAGRILLQHMVEVAQLEAFLVGKRTRKALAASEKKLGGYRGRPGTPADLEKARAARTRAALQRAEGILPILTRLDPEGTSSLQALAGRLTDEGVPPPSGRGTWSPKAVARLRQRLKDRML